MLVHQRVGHVGSVFPTSELEVPTVRPHQFCGFAGFGATQALNTVAVSASAVGLCGCAALIGVSWRPPDLLGPGFVSTWGRPLYGHQNMGEHDDKSYGFFCPYGNFRRWRMTSELLGVCGLESFWLFHVVSSNFFCPEGHVFQTCFLRLQVFTKSSATSPKLSTSRASPSHRVCGESSVRRVERTKEPLQRSGCLGLGRWRWGDWEKHGDLM